jgi:hypothetical protein
LGISSLRFPTSHLSVRRGTPCISMVHILCKVLLFHLIPYLREEVLLNHLASSLSEELLLICTPCTSTFSLRRGTPILHLSFYVEVPVCNFYSSCTLYLARKGIPCLPYTNSVKRCTPIPHCIFPVRRVMPSLPCIFSLIFQAFPVMESPESIGKRQTEYLFHYILGKPHANSVRPSARFGLEFT